MKVPSDSSYPSQWVDPFIGCEATSLPSPQGIASTWFWPKAQVGNTHPGACYPFGMLSACAFSGAYPTGYGCYDRSTEGPPGKLYDTLSASGFTHFQQSGPGDMRIFYNHLRVTPFTSKSGDLQQNLSQLGKRWPLKNEKASPGYYTATLDNLEIQTELTVSAKAACHRYSFSNKESPQLILDLSTDGVDVPERKAFPSEAHLEMISPQTAQGMVVLKGVPLYVYLELNTPAQKYGLWSNCKTIESHELAIKQSQPDSQKSFGFYFEFEPLNQVELKIGFSFRNISQAKANVTPIHNQNFDQILQNTQTIWQQHLNRIRITEPSSEKNQIFYTALYHSLIKPANMENESPFWPEPGPFFTDISTMWDIYKTQIPLLLSVYPETGKAFINALLEMAERHHRFPIGYIIAENPFLFEKQASALAHISIADAFFRHLRGIDFKRALSLMTHELNNGKGATFQSEGSVYPFTHTLDLACACFATAQIAQHYSKQTLYQRLMELAGKWRNVYNKETGTLAASDYYEGGAWNYSFRLLHDMAGRIALFDSPAHCVSILDQFFGFDQPPCQQLTYPPDPEIEKKGYALRRFSGLNNEPDMETPYTYIYAGRPDRTAEVVHAALKYQYTTGRGGLPGNDDSGALSSWYVWSALGIFPVAGQPVYLIGSPHFEKAEIQLENKTFTILTSKLSDDNIYIQTAKLNGKPIDRAYLRIDEFEKGGTLEVTMGSTPSSWGKKNLPPSFKV